MRTVIIENIKSETRNIVFGYWDMDEEEFVPIEDATPEMAKVLGISELMLDAIIGMVGQIKDNVHADLFDIWKRLDKIEEIT